MDALTKAATLARLAETNPSALSDSGMASVKGAGVFGMPVAGGPSSADAPWGFTDGPGIRLSSPTGMLVHGPGASAMLRGDGDGLRNSAVFAVLRSKAEAYIEPPLRVYRGPRGDIANSEIRPDHKAMGILQREVSPWVTSDRFRYAMRLALDTWGDYYAVLIRGGGGTVQDNTTGPLLHLWGVTGDAMRPARRKGASVPITHYEWDIGKREPLEIPVENVIAWHSGVDPRNPLLGMGALRIVTREIMTDTEADALVYYVLKNSGVPGLVISPAGDKPFGGQALESFKESIRARTSGANRGDLFVSPQAASVEQYSFDPKGLNLGPVWKHIESRIAAVLGWPASLAGLQAGMELKYSNSGEAREHATETTLMSAWNMDGQVWDQLVRRCYGLAPDEYVAHDWSQVRALQDDMQAAHVREMDQIKQGLLTRDEYRVAHGWGDLPNDDPGLLAGDREGILQLIRAVGTGEVQPGTARNVLTNLYRLTEATALALAPDELGPVADATLAAPVAPAKASPGAVETKADDKPVPVSTDDLDAASADWDKWAPAEFRGMLDTAPDAND